MIKFFTLKKVDLGILIVISFHLFLLSILLFTAWPEMTFWPYLILKGWLPYKDIAIAHNPLLVVILTIFYKIAGVGVNQLKFFTWSLIILTDLFLFYVTRKLFDRRTAVFAILPYIILQTFFAGNGLWFDLLLAPLGLGIFYFSSKEKFVLAGILFALAFLTKQTAIWFLPAVLVTIVTGENKKKLLSHLSQFILGVVPVILFTFGLLILLNIFQDYLYWTVTFGIFTLPASPGQIQYPSLKQFIFYFFPFIPLAAVIVLKERKYFLLALWTFMGLGGVFPRWELFHFQPALPFLAISIALLLRSKIFRGNKFAVLAIVYMLIMLFIVIRFFRADLNKGTRFYDQGTLTAAGEIRKITQANEKIYIINAWDNLYSLTGTVPAIRPWYPHLAWYMGLPGVEEKIVNELRESSPAWVITTANSEGLSAYQPEFISSYIEAHYSLVKSLNDYRFLLKIQ